MSVVDDNFPEVDDFILGGICFADPDGIETITPTNVTPEVTSRVRIEAQVDKPVVTSGIAEPILRRNVEGNFAVYTPVPKDDKIKPLLEAEGWDTCGKSIWIPRVTHDGSFSRQKLLSDLDDTIKSCKLQLLNMFKEAKRKEQDKASEDWMFIQALDDLMTARIDDMKDEISKWKKVTAEDDRKRAAYKQNQGYQNGFEKPSQKRNLKSRKKRKDTIEVSGDQIKDRVKCTKCNRRFSHNCFMVSHYLDKHEPPIYQCDICGYGTSRNTSISMHYQNKHRITFTPEQDDEYHQIRKRALKQLKEKLRKAFAKRKRGTGIYDKSHIKPSQEEVQMYHVDNHDDFLLFQNPEVQQDPVEDNKIDEMMSQMIKFE